MTTILRLFESITPNEGYLAMIITSLLNYWLLYNFPSHLVVEGIHVSALLIGHLLNSWWHSYVLIFSSICLTITVILDFENLSSWEHIQWRIFCIGIIAANLPFLHTLAFPILYYDAWLPMIMPYIFQNGRWIPTPYYVLNTHPITRICFQVLMMISTTVAGMVLEKILRRPYNIHLQNAWWDETGLPEELPTSLSKKQNHIHRLDLNTSTDSEDLGSTGDKFFKFDDLTPQASYKQPTEQHTDCSKRLQNNSSASLIHIDNEGSSTPTSESDNTTGSPVGISKV